MEQIDWIQQKVTRIEVIDNDGRAVVRYYDSPGVLIDIQDEGRTLKVFAGQRSEMAKEG